MIDLLFIVILVAFFALMVAFVRLCERIVGKDEADRTDAVPEDTEIDPTEHTTPEEVPA